MKVLFTFLVFIGSLVEVSFAGCPEALVEVSRPNTHSKCRLPTIVPIMTDADKRIILDEHNKYRGQADPPPKYMFKMYWDEEAAKTALGWANSMCQARGGGPDHDPITARFLPGRNAYGQNWFVAGGQGSTWKQAIKSWYDEKTEENFSYEEGGNHGTGHYTQVMWADSVLVGCAKLYCDLGNKGEYFVCNYARAGNEPNFYGKKERPYFKSDVRGSGCGSNFDSATGLCDCKDVKFCLNGGRMNPATCQCTCPKKPWIVGPNCELDCTKGITDESGFGCSSFDCQTDNIFDRCAKSCRLCPVSGSVNYLTEAAKIKAEQPQVSSGSSSTSNIQTNNVVDPSSGADADFDDEWW